MEPGGSMPHSQGLSNNSYPDTKLKYVYNLSDDLFAVHL